MKLLFITQVWDKNDSVLGFVPSWVEAFRPVSTSLSVIALRVSSSEHLNGIPVHSLRKEEGRGHTRKIFRFYQLLWDLRNSYDTVFVHMNPEYVVLAGFLWRLMGKKVVLWYAHGIVTWKLHAATPFCSRILTSTPEGCRISSKKLRVIGQAIDTELFSPASHVPLIPKLVVVGRIAETKSQALAVRALALIHKEYPEATLEIIGAPVYDADRIYESSVRELSRELGVESFVRWCGPLTRIELARELPHASLCINMSTNGSLDKAGLEALAAGVPVITANPAFRSILMGVADILFMSSQESSDVSRAILLYLTLPSEEREHIRRTLRERAVAEHSITTFAERVVSTL